MTENNHSCDTTEGHVGVCNTTEADATESRTDAPTREQIKQAIEDVTDPDLGVDVFSSGLVTNVSIADGHVSIDVEDAGMDPSMAEESIEAVRTAVLETPGVERVRVERSSKSADNQASPNAETEENTSSLHGVESVIAVASAKGGVGKTTVATQLACALSAEGHDVGLFDADIYGPNLPAAFDLDGPITAADDGRAEPATIDGLELMSVGLIANDAPIAWRGSMAHEAVLELIEETAWHDRDTLVIDLPPGTGDVVLTTLQSVPVDGAVFVTTPYPTAVTDTARSIQLFRENGISVLGAVVNMAGFTCPDCGTTHELFFREDTDTGTSAGSDSGSDFDLDLDVPVLAELPFDDSLRVTDTSTVPVRFRKLGAAVLNRFEVDDAMTVPDSALDVRGVPPRIQHEQFQAEVEALDPGEPIYVVSDNDPRSLLARPAATDSDRTAEDGSRGVAFDETDSTVQQRGPNEWVLRVHKPEQGGNEAA